MRRALSQLCPGAPGASLLVQLSATSGGSAVRCAGEASTSYGSATGDGMLVALVRGLAAKAAAKSKAAPPAPAAPAAAPKPPSGPGALATAGQRLLRRKPRPDPLALLTPEQRQLAEALIQPTPAGGVAAAAADAADLASASAAASAEGAPGVPLRGLGQVGLPLDRRDVASLLQQSLSGAVEQNVHFQPFIFSNIFQSAPAVATYVAAALESGTTWSRVERFFLAAVEADTILRGVRVEVRGRIGRKADMASSKKWEWGDVTRKELSDHIDYGASPAFTRLGVLGVKVWLRYKKGAVPELFFPATGGSHYRTPTPARAKPDLSLDQLYGAALARTTRVALPYRFSAVGWWERTAAQQPVANRAGEVFTADFDPSAGDRLEGYLRRRREEGRRFRTAEERRSYLETTGRFLAKQRHMAEVRRALLVATTSESAPGLPSPLGRRPDRALGRHRPPVGTRGRIRTVVVRFRAEQQREQLLQKRKQQAAAKAGKGKGRKAARAQDSDMEDE